MYHGNFLVCESLFQFATAFVYHLKHKSQVFTIRQGESIYNAR